LNLEISGFSIPKITANKQETLSSDLMRSFAILSLCLVARAAAQCTGAKNVNLAITSNADVKKLTAAAACPNKVIQVTLKAAVTLTEPIVVSATTSLSINGAKNTARSFDGAGTAQLFNVQGNLTLVGVTLQGGSSPDYGGAINSTASAFISIRDCTFQGCKAKQGGAIHTKGNLDITSSQFKSSIATSTGGAIEAGTGSELSIASTLFDTNLAGKQLQQSIVYNYIFSCTKLLTNVVCGSVITLAELGGAVAAAGSLDISNCNFKNNKASASGGAVIAISSSGSSKGAAAVPQLKQSIANTTFSANSAAVSGGALVRQGPQGIAVQRESIKNALVLTQVHIRKQVLSFRCSFRCNSFLTCCPSTLLHGAVYIICVFYMQT
jgi:predicted outer membrane repeat protein